MRQLPKRKAGTTGRYHSSADDRQAGRRGSQGYVSEEKGVKNVAEALNGAKDIIAERISDEADYRIYIRNLTTKNGSISSTAKNAETQSVYEMYYEFEEPVRKLAGHRILALNRGEKEKFITVKVNAPEEDILRYLNKRVIKKTTRIQLRF